MAKRGAMPKFDIHHLVWALFLIAENDKPGRQRLAELMGVGEGTCRGILKELDDKGLIATTRSGISLSRRGKRMMEGLPVVHGEMSLGPLALADYAHAVAIRDHARFVKTGLEQRDAAVRDGAVGATALVFSKGELRFPDGRKLADDYVEDAALLTELFHPLEGDVIVVGYGRDPVSAESGTFAAAVILLFAPCDALEEMR